MGCDVERTDFERRTAAAYFRDFVPAVVGYCVFTLAVILLVDFETTGWWKYLAALLPLLPALWGARAIIRHVDRIDELARSNIMAAMSVGFAVAMVTALTMGLLNIAGLESRYWGAWTIYGAGMAGWSIAGIRLQARNE